MSEIDDRQATAMPADILPPCRETDSHLARTSGRSACHMGAFTILNRGKYNENAQICCHLVHHRRSGTIGRCLQTRAWPSRKSGAKNRSGLGYDAKGKDAWRTRRREGRTNRGKYSGCFQEVRRTGADCGSHTRPPRFTRSVGVPDKPASSQPMAEASLFHFRHGVFPR